MKNFTEIIINNTITSFDEFQTGSYLILTDLHLTPPHCSLLTNNHWFSLNYSECKITPAENFFKLIQSKNKPAIFLKLNIELNQSVFKDVFSKYPKINFSKQITCITPIKEILILHSVYISQNGLLFELLEELFSLKRIEKVLAYNFSENTYVIKHYSDKHLLSLNL